MTGVVVVGAVVTPVGGSASRAAKRWQLRSAAAKGASYEPCPHLGSAHPLLIGTVLKLGENEYQGGRELGGNQVKKVDGDD